MPYSSQQVVRRTDGIRPAGWQPPEQDAEDQNQDECDPEGGDAVGDRTYFADEPIGKAVLFEGAENSKTERQQESEQIGAPS